MIAKSWNTNVSERQWSFVIAPGQFHKWEILYHTNLRPQHLLAFTSTVPRNQFHPRYRSKKLYIYIYLHARKAWYFWDMFSKIPFDISPCLTLEALRIPSHHFFYFRSIRWCFCTGKNLESHTGRILTGIANLLK